MTIDTDTLSERFKLTYELIQTLTADGAPHEVAIFAITSPNDDVGTYKRVLCECHAHECEVRDEVVRRAAIQARSRNTKQWGNMLNAEAALNIVMRIETQGEYFGERCPGMITVSEIAALLSISEDETYQQCLTMARGRKLEFQGRFVVPYTPRFRFPVEIRMLMAWVIDNGLGWPDGGDVGTRWIAKLERAVGEGLTNGDVLVDVMEHDAATALDIAPDAGIFHQANTPYLSTPNLLFFAQVWAGYAADRLKRHSYDRGQFDALTLEHAANNLRAMASQIDEIAAQMKLKEPPNE